MTARRLREWPRLVALLIVSAGLLILIGIAVAVAASSGGGTKSRTAAVAPAASSSTPTTAPAPAPAQTATLRRLRATVQAQGSQLARLQSALRTARDRAYCWRDKAVHAPGASHRNCAQIT